MLLSSLNSAAKSRNQLLLRLVGSSCKSGITIMISTCINKQGIANLTNLCQLRLLALITLYWFYRLTPGPFPPPGAERTYLFRFGHLFWIVLLLLRAELQKRHYKLEYSPYFKERATSKDRAGYILYCFVMLFFFIYLLYIVLFVIELTLISIVKVKIYKIYKAWLIY